MDSTTFKKMILPHYEEMYRVAYIILEDRHDAFDAVQEAVVKLWTKREELEGIQSAKGFCMTTIKRQCIDMPRTRYRRNEPLDIALENDEADDDIVKRIDQRDTLEKVAQLMDTLPAIQREALRLRAYSDCSVKEISELLGITTDNTRTLLSRARRQLKELYKHLIR